MGSLPDLVVLPRRELWGEVHESLRDAIIAGEFNSKARLGEDEISEKLGVSRWPIRQAITRLEQEGLVIRLPHRGAFVKFLSESEVHEIYSLRILLEGHAAREGAGKATPKILKQLYGLVEQNVEAANAHDYVRYFKIDTEFHSTIIKIANSPKLLTMWNLLLPSVQVLLVWGAKDDPDRINGIKERHEAIIDAIKKGDPDEIEGAVKQHLIDAEVRALRTCRRISQFS